MALFPDISDPIARLRSSGFACRSVSGLLTIWHNADATRQSEEWLREHSPIPLFSQKIRRTDKVTESTYAAQPVTRWSPTSAAARDYRAWVEELMEVL